MNLRRERQPHAAHAKEGVRFAVDRDSGYGLVAAGIQRADHDRTTAGPGNQATVKGDLSRLVRRPLCKQQLGAYQADAIADRRMMVSL
jgi:hypothetical protein